MESLKLQSESFVGREQTHLVDVLYSIDFKGERKQAGYIYCLCEHKSQPEHFLAVQVMRYVLEILTRSLKNKKGYKIGKKKYLPMVVPLVFYHGQPSPYPYSLDIRDCFEDRELAESLFNGPCRLIDFGQIPDDELEQRGLASAFMCLQKHIFARDLVAFLGDYLPNVLQPTVAQLGKDYLFLAAKYATNKGSIENIDLFKDIFIELIPEQKEDWMTIAEALEAKGRQEGEAKGRQEGRQEGEVKGLEKAIESMLANDQPVDFIANVLPVEIEEVQRIASELETDGQ